MDNAATPLYSNSLLRLSEVSCKRLLECITYIVQRGADRQFALDGCHSPLSNAAWYNVSEQSKVITDVEGKAVGRHPSATVNANGADLPLLLDPNTG